MSDSNKIVRIGSHSGEIETPGSTASAAVQVASGREVKESQLYEQFANLLHLGAIYFGQEAARARRVEYRQSIDKQIDALEEQRSKLYAEDHC